jgi:hypothetical protein
MENEPNDIIIYSLRFKNDKNDTLLDKPVFYGTLEEIRKLFLDLNIFAPPIVNGKYVETIRKMPNFNQLPIPSKSVIYYIGIPTKKLIANILLTEINHDLATAHNEDRDKPSLNHEDWANNKRENTLLLEAIEKFFNITDPKEILKVLQMDSFKRDVYLASK